MKKVKIRQAGTAASKDSARRIRVRRRVHPFPGPFAGHDRQNGESRQLPHRRFGRSVRTPWAWLLDQVEQASNAQAATRTALSWIGVKHAMPEPDRSSDPVGIRPREAELRRDLEEAERTNDRVLAFQLSTELIELWVAGREG
jgi:hypothetical protein